MLIELHAATATAASLVGRRGAPFFSRFVTGLIRLKKPIVGMELAGEIETVGKDVKLFKEVDQVFGNTGLSLGAYAEYKCLVEEEALAIFPQMLWTLKIGSKRAIVAFTGLRPSSD